MKQIVSRFLVICALVMPISIYAVDDFVVSMASNLKLTAESAKKQQLPLMMFFAAEDCVFCERLEADYLNAMANSEEYKHKVIIRKIVIDSYDEFSDFNGKRVEASDFSDKYNIQVTPTLVLVDHQGSRVARRIIGYNDSGFFGAELDNAIESASKNIRNTTPN